MRPMRHGARRRGTARETYLQALKAEIERSGAQPLSERYAPV